MTEAYPLAWPDGWPRTPADLRKDGRYQFKRLDYDKGWRVPWTFALARDALIEEVSRMKAGNVVVSSNFATDRRGLAVEGKRRPEDEGVAVYFLRGGKAYVMACDRYTRAEENMRSLTLALDAMRQLERHGGGVMMEKAFEGFTALPTPKRPHEILGVSENAGELEIRRAWRERIASAHPDQGGSEAAAAEINAARDAMLKKLKAIA